MKRGPNFVRKGENPSKPCEHCGKPIFYRDQPNNYRRKRFCSRECDKVFKFRSKGPDHFMWSKVDKNGPNGCWIYTGACDRRGYGRPGVYVRTKEDGSSVTKRYYVHRRSYEIHKGEIPAGMLVLHKCDNPPCCNPDHLFLGTDADNHADKVAKGRHTYGELTKRNKLTPEQVREIRANPPIIGHGGNVKEYAERYGVSCTNTIINAARGNTWGNLK